MVSGSSGSGFGVDASLSGKTNGKVFVSIGGGSPDVRMNVSWSVRSCFWCPPVDIGNTLFTSGSRQSNLWQWSNNWRNGKHAVGRRNRVKRKTAGNFPDISGTNKQRGKRRTSLQVCKQGVFSSRINKCLVGYGIPSSSTGQR